MQITIRYILLNIMFISLATSCSDNGSGPDTELPARSLVYVTNEGNFGDSNGSITAYDMQSDSVIKQAFQNANKRPLAGTLQSASIADNKLYLNLNNANKIEIADPNNLTSMATIPVTTNITALQVIDESTAYATNLYNSSSIDSVSIINLSEMIETDQRIAVGDQPRDIAKVGNLVYVANTGFSGSGETISVINTETGKVMKTINVGIAPTKMIVDTANQIWVVCNGLIAYDDDFMRDPESDKPGSVFVINGENASVTDQISVDGHPNDLVLNEHDGRGYLLDDGVTVIDLDTKELTRSLFDDNHLNGIYYSEEEQLIYVGKIPNGDYGQPGRVIRYDLNGSAVDSFITGVAPNGFFISDN